jgi:hypothetical protein
MFWGRFTRSAVFAAVLVSTSALAQITTPTPVSPLATSSTNQPTFVWNEVTNASSYEIYVIYGSTATLYPIALTNCASGQCAFNPGLTLPTGNAWWLVRAFGLGTSSYWTDYLYFYVPRPVGPVAISPSGSTAETKPTYRWYPVAGATGYIFSLRDETRFLEQNTSVPTSACTGNPTVCSFTSNRTLAAENTWWMVRATTAVGDSSETQTYFRAEPNKPAAPTAISPMGIISTATPTYTWAPVTGANEYWFRLANENGVILAAVRVASNNCNTTQCTYTPANALTPNLNTWWWIQARDANDYSNWSQAIGLRYHPTPLAAPAAVSPLGTITTLTPSYVWNPVGGATLYDLYVVDQAGTPVPVTQVSSSVCTGSPVRCTYAPGAVLARGAAWWYVRARNATNFGTWSGAQSFFVNPPTLSAPTQLSPTGQISTTTPSYTWNEVVGAASYEVWVSDEAAVKYVGPANATCSAGTCTSSPGTTLISGNAWWWVRTFDSTGGASGWAGPMSFRVP